MTISFPAPSAAVVAEARSGRRISAARSWMKEARVVLQNGCEVTPMMRVAYDTTQAIANGMPSIAVAVTEGSYELASSSDNREAANKLRSERFQHFMAEDCPPEHGIGVCDACGLIGASVRNHYASDGMGYPTLVLQQCVDGCTEVN
jgi:hypothetical protein